MSNTVRWGVIGSGGIARRRTIPEGIVPARNAELVSVYGTNDVTNNEVAAEWNAAAVSTIPDLVNTDIDAVYVASPVDAHVHQVIECAKAGKHILCEKPLGLSMDEIQHMIQACEESNVKFGTALMMRFHSQHQAALKLVQDSKLGKPTFARAQLSCWYPPMEKAWRQDPTKGGGGSLIDMGSHCIDLLEMFFGPVTKLHCFINNTIHDYQSEDSALVSLFFETGAMASVDTFFCIPDESSKNCLELYGSGGSILAKGTIGQGEAGEMTAYLQDETSGYDAHQQRDESGGISISPDPVNMYKAEIEEFSSAILENRKPSNHAGLGLRNQQLLTACYESAITGNTIAV